MPVLMDIKSFVSVAEAGGFSRAARQSGVSTSVISRRVDRLEGELGVCLLLRNTRHITLTAAGDEFYRRGKQILAELEDAYQAVAEPVEAIGGPLRITAPYSFGIRYLEPVLDQLALHYPQLEFDISYSDHYADLQNEPYDVAVRIGRINELSFAARKISSLRTVVVASQDYLRQYGRPDSLAELSSRDCLIYSGRTLAEWVFEKQGVTTRVLPGGRYRSDSGEVLLRWLLAGRGIANLPAYMVSEALAAGQVEILFPDYRLPEYDLYILRPPGVRVAGKVRVFIDRLTAYCQQCAISNL